MRTCPVDLKSDFALDDQGLLEQKDNRNSAFNHKFRDSLARQPLHSHFKSSPMDLRNRGLQVPQTRRSRTLSHEGSENLSGVDDDDDTSMERESSPGLTYGELRKRLHNTEFEDNDLHYETTLENRPRTVHGEPYNERKTESRHDGNSHRKREDTGSFGNKIMVILLGVLVVSLVCGIVWYLNSEGTGESSLDEAWIEENLKSNIKIVRDSFPSQIKNIWISFYSGIKKVLLEKPTEPSVFLLIHEGTDDISSCLARSVASAAHKFLNASKPDPLVIEGRVLGKNETLITDYGHLISDYRPLVEEHRVMILNDLQLVPASLARGLHIFCDNVTPLVHKAVYIFTLNISKGNDKGNPTKIAETELFSIWKQLDNDILSPLIARITGGFVFRIQPEESTNIC